MDKLKEGLDPAEALKAGAGLRRFCLFGGNAKHERCVSMGGSQEV